MNLARRNFISSLAATGAWATIAGVPAGGATAGARAAHDPALAVFFADTHLRRDFQRDRFIGAVAAVLRMNPLPANVVIFGDLAYLTGRPEDYRLAAACLEPLAKAGIKVTIGMGNHDERKNFLAQFSAYEKSTPVPGNIVSKIAVGPVDLIMLDTLRENPRKPPGNNFVDGELSAAQQDWLVAQAPTFTRPTFFCSHHPTKELTVKGVAFGKWLCSVPAAAGHIYGHNHRWSRSWAHRGWSNPHDPRTVRTLCLPSTGHWGDIGHVIFRAGETSATATLVQTEFYFPIPPKDNEVPQVWRDIVAENRNQVCTFRY